MNERDRRTLLIALHAAPELGRPAFYRLGEDLSWRTSALSVDRLAPELGVPRSALRRARRCAERAAALARDEERAVESAGGRLVVRGEREYPECLEALPLPPPVLALRGAIPSGPAIAVVGSRRPDAYGVEVAEAFARALADAGVAVVSGFARGIDAAAHRAALAARRGTTVAVLGCGLCVDYPRGHRALAAEVAASGAQISEFASGAQPQPWHFPLRNRTIAALAAATLVVRAAPRSGSLITARHALDLGRTVWAVPGSIFEELSLGPNALLRDGAAPALHPRDLLDEILPPGAARGASAPLRAHGPGDPSGGEPAASPGEECGAASAPLPAGLPGQLLAALAAGDAVSAEELALRTASPVDRVLAALLDLEIDGLVHKRPGFGYAR